MSTHACAYRIVPDDDKSFALAFNSFVYNLLGKLIYTAVQFLGCSFIS